MSRNINNISQTNGYNVIKPNIPEFWSDQFKSKTHSTTGDMGKIIPIYWRECQPGEKINLTHQIGIQFTPFVTNLLHEIKGEIIDYYVPYRIAAFLRQVESIDGDTYEEADQIKWDAFITGGKNGQDSQLLERFRLKIACNNRINSGKKVEQSLLDYFYNYQHVTVESSTASENLYVNRLKLNCYNLIYNECLRNPDFTEWKKMNNPSNAAEDSIITDTATAYWMNDRYTRARKYQIRGAMPEIPISSETFTEYVKWETAKSTIGTDKDIMWTRKTADSDVGKIPLGSIETPLGTASGDQKTLILGMQAAETSTANDEIEQTGTPGFAGQPIEIKGAYTVPGVAATMNYTDFLYNLHMLQYLANNARMKPRYSEYLRYRYGIIPGDARMHEPEWINSYSFNLTVDAVTSTAGGTAPSSDPSDTNPYQGNITGQAWGYGRQDNKSIYECKEHGMWMSLLIVRPANVYEGGLEKIDRGDRDRFSFPLPEFMNLPDEEIKGSELYFTGSPDDDNYSLGYEQIYDYYRSETNIVTGYLRPSLPAGLGMYTLARKFDSPVELNDSFLKCVPDMQRIKQYPEQPDMLIFHRETIQEAINLPIVNNPVINKY